MSEQPPLAQMAPPRVWPMYRSLVGVGLLCGLLIVTAFELTRPIIDHNKAEALKRAIFRVLPDARTSAAFRLGDDGHFTPAAGAAGEGRVVYAGYDDDRHLVGLAVEAQGMGYQDVIHLLYGYSPAADAIVGVEVLESRETPGLGDKISSDAAWTKNFERLDVALNEDRSALLHPLEFVKHGSKTHPWQIDGITGATISSRAVAEMLGASAAEWVPRIRRSTGDFQAAE